MGYTHDKTETSIDGRWGCWGIEENSEAFSKNFLRNADIEWWDEKSRAVHM